MDIYPVIELKEGKCARLRRGLGDSALVFIEDPLKIAKHWRDQGAQKLHLSDVDGARKGAPSAINLDAVRRIIRQVGLPVQLEGGIRTAEIVERMLAIGVTRCVIGTIAAQDVQKAGGIFMLYGDKVAVRVDSRAGMVGVYGREVDVQEPAIAFVKRMAALGARRFVFSDLGRESALQGVNIETVRQIALAAPTIPVIASGGIGSVTDMDLLTALTAECPNVEGFLINQALYAETVSLPDLLTRA